MPILNSVQNLNVSDKIEVARVGQKFTVDGVSLGDSFGPLYQRSFNWVPGFQFSEIKPPVNNSAQLFQQTPLGYAPMSGYAAGSTSTSTSSTTTAGSTAYFDNYLIGTNLASSTPAAGLVSNYAAFPVRGSAFAGSTPSPWYAGTYVRIMASTGYSTVFGTRTAIGTEKNSAFGAWFEYDPTASAYWTMHIRVNGGTLITADSFINPSTSNAGNLLEIYMLPNNRVQFYIDGANLGSARSVSGSATTGGSVLPLVAGSYRTTATGAASTLVSRMGAIQSRVQVATGTGLIP